MERDLLTLVKSEIPRVSCQEGQAASHGHGLKLLFIGRIYFLSGRNLKPASQAFQLTE